MKEQFNATIVKMDMPYTYKGYTIELYRTTVELFEIDEHGEIVAGMIGTQEVTDEYRVHDQQGDIVTFEYDDDETGVEYTAYGFPSIERAREYIDNLSALDD